MSGTVAVVAQDSARYTMFSVCLTQLKHPPGTRIDWGISTYVPGARNTLVRRSLEEGADWILFLDDDQIFAPDLLMNLLAWDKPVVSALYLQRAGSHEPVALNREEGGYRPIDLKTLPGEGLLKVDAVGAGGLLVRTDIFRMEDRWDWFSYSQDESGWAASEDVIFCERLARLGIDVYVDLATTMGHMAPSSIWPSYIDKEWCFGFSVSDSTRVFVPIETDAAQAADAVRR
jgi:hypothetical protein